MCASSACSASAQPKAAATRRVSPGVPSARTSGDAPGLTEDDDEPEGRGARGHEIEPDPRDDLVDAEARRGDAEQTAEECPRSDAREQSQERTARRERNGDGREGARRQRALERDVDDARALAENARERRIHERRRLHEYERGKRKQSVHFTAVTSRACGRPFRRDVTARREREDRQTFDEGHDVFGHVRERLHRQAAAL